MSEPKQPDFNTWMTDTLKKAHDIGFASGFEKGAIVGYALAMEHTKTAVSEGLRNGSPECGKNMRSRRKD